MTKSFKLIGLAVTLVVSTVFGFGCAEKPALTAPIVDIVIYTDFQCAGCATLHSEVEAELLRLYVDTGKARLEMRLLPALGPESLRAAEAALCAADQGKFWEYRSTILTAWCEVGKAAYSEEQLRQAASEVGLNVEIFSACLDSGAKRAEVEEYMNQSIADDVPRIPAVFINGIKVEGVEPLDTYVNIIEQELAK